MPKLLIVEPDISLSKAIEKFFNKEQFKVSIARDAQAAIAATDKAEPDIIVLELAMPRHNGVAFLHELRSYSDWLNVPVVVYTHIPQADTGMSEADWQKYGVKAYLYKPTTSLASLSQHIKNNLNTHETI